MTLTAYHDDPARVPFHTLVREGQGFAIGPSRYMSGTGWVPDPSGVGRCSCGETSAALPSKAARKRWHRSHKADVLARRSHG